MSRTPSGPGGACPAASGAGAGATAGAAGGVSDGDAMTVSGATAKAATQARAPSLRQPHPDQRQQLLDVERLRDVVVRAGVQALLLVVAHRLRRERDHRQAAP